MTELKLNSKPETSGRASNTDRRYFVMTLCGGLLLVALFVGLTASSKQGSKHTSVNPINQSSSTQNQSAGMLGSAPGPLPAPEASVQPVAKKKQVKHRSPTVTYVDSTYGVSFTYPRKFTLKTGELAKLESGAAEQATKFVQPGEVMLARLELPSALYKGTDFVYGFFNVSVNKGLSSEQCGQFAAPVAVAGGDVAVVETGKPEHQESSVSETISPEKSLLVPSKASIRGVEFAKLETTTDLSNTKYYHRFENNACYEFALGLKTAEHESVDMGVPVDDRDVFARLEKILSSVRIKSEVLPQVATQVAAGSGGESSQH